MLHFSSDKSALSVALTKNHPVSYSFNGADIRNCILTALESHLQSTMNDKEKSKDDNRPIIVFIFMENRIRSVHELIFTFEIENTHLFTRREE